ncbi:unnamed protein product [Aphanomyces euteiches]|uniref:Uncharacterized protein n=1 Tax=Aphanomyces euteiches TaxID=100861 RepID=A0A6G0XHR9_9STRA|nr:hypothetical protein Ae201684_004805 [Aphanomyces euteiches]
MSTIRETRQRLLGLGIAANEANAILSHAHKPPVPRETLYLHPDRDLAPQTTAVVEAMASRRLQGEPLAYVLGVKEFWSLLFKVTRDTLIPRPETEMLIELSLELYDTDAPLRVLDLGTGTGCLLVSTLTMFPQASGVALDVSSAALAVAIENAAAHNLASRATFVQQDMRHLNNTDDIKSWAGDGFDLVLCNPPYIAQDELDVMDTHVVEYEPHVALFADDNGLDMYKQLVQPLRALVRPGGHVLFEVGFQQAQDVVAMYTSSGHFGQSGKLNRSILPDLQGIHRVVALQRNESGPLCQSPPSQSPKITDNLNGYRSIAAS